MITSIISNTDIDILSPYPNLTSAIVTHKDQDTASTTSSFFIFTGSITIIIIIVGIRTHGTSSNNDVIPTSIAYNWIVPSLIKDKILSGKETRLVLVVVTLLLFLVLMRNITITLNITLTLTL
jgi:hypothetical protein